MKRWFKETAKNSLVKVFHLGQRLGFDLLPRHFYSEVPDIRFLRRTETWRRPYSLIGIQGADDLEHQVAGLRGWLQGEISDQVRSRNLHEEASRRNGDYGYGGPIDSNCLYAFIRNKRPAKVFQIGCGVSTALCLLAAADADYQPEITCIEPYPTDFLTTASKSGEIRLIEEPVQVLPLEFLEEISSGDLFFVDSTHTLGPAGEVTRIITEMLPRLPKGALVHFHDIWFPYDYVPKILRNGLFFYHETALLMAFLSGNPQWRVLVSMSQLHHRKPADLQELMPTYEPRQMQDGVQVGNGAGDYPNAIYLEKIG